MRLCHDYFMRCQNCIHILTYKCALQLVLAIDHKEARQAAVYLNGVYCDTNELQ